MTELEDVYARCRIVEKRLAEATAGLLEFADKLSHLRTENKRMREDHLFVAETAQGMLDIGNAKIDRLTAENKRMQDMLEELLDYFQEEYDTVDDENCQPMPNRAMKWGQAIEEALGRGGRYV